jgi:glutathione reductase (NADPH)
LAQEAVFTGPKAVRVGNQEYTADHILIAVGGKPSMPRISGIEHAMDSDGFFRLDKLPKKVAVVGAGYIAVELAGVLQELGSETTLVVRGDIPLRNFDELMSTTLVSEMKKAGLKLVSNFSPKVRAHTQGRRDELALL